jgi:replicative DNA helicase
MSDNNSLPDQQLAPHSIDAEEAVLGAILLNSDVIYELATFLDSSSFYILRNSWVWDAMHRLMMRNESIDRVTVVEELRNTGHLDEIGGPAYITYLLNSTATYLHAEVYGRIVERAAIRRRLLTAASQIAQLAMTADADVDEVVNNAEATLFAATERHLRNDLAPISQAVSDYFDHIEYLYENQGERLGVPTGFTDLDNLLGGMQKSDLLILAARPGMGKTSFKLNVAMNAARLGARVAIFSLEMGNDQLVQRLISTDTGINSQALRLGQLDEREWGLFVQACGKLANLSIFLDDTPALTPLQLRTKCRRLYREQGLDLIVVDYLQLMSSGRANNENRVQEISYISRHLKELARELKVPILAGAQLSRAVEQRGDKRPLLSDLRESGSIEQDADIVMFIYRDDLYNEESERPNVADIIIAKHRNGPTGSVSLHFNSQLTKFTNLKYDSETVKGF